MASMGSFKVGDGRVTLSRGRGANRAVLLDVSFKELEVWAARNGIDERRLWQRSFGGACKTLRQKMQKVVSAGGGVEGVPKFKDFEDFTRQLRTATNRTYPIGGKLASQKLIRIDKVGKSVYIGWPDELRRYAVAFQDGEGGSVAERFLQSNQSRHWIHMRGIKYVPREYVHNPRRVLPEPFGTTTARYLSDWAERRFYKELARQMARSRHF